jgi:hypothetical protein
MKDELKNEIRRGGTFPNVPCGIAVAGHNRNYAAAIKMDGSSHE